MGENAKMGRPVLALEVPVPHGLFGCPPLHFVDGSELARQEAKMVREAKANVRNGGENKLEKKWARALERRRRPDMPSSDDTDREHYPRPPRPKNLNRAGNFSSTKPDAGNTRLTPPTRSQMPARYSYRTHKKTTPTVQPAKRRFLLERDTLPSSLSVQNNDNNHEIPFLALPPPLSPFPTTTRTTNSTTTRTTTTSTQRPVPRSQSRSRIPIRRAGYSNLLRPGNHQNPHATTTTGGQDNAIYGADVRAVSTNVGKGGARAWWKKLPKSWQKRAITF